MTHTLAVPQSTRTYSRDELLRLWQRARERAVNERTRAWRMTPTAWTASTQLDGDDYAASHYTVVELGPGPFDTACPCRAGQFGAPCKHRAVVAMARASGIDQLIMAAEPSAAAAHCIGCGRWYAVYSDTDLYCASCKR